MQDVVVIVCYLIDTKNKGTKLLMNYADPRVIFSGVLTPPINPSNPKQFWKIAKLLNKNSSLVKNGYTATTDADKATMLKGFFSMFQHCSTTIVDKPGGTFELLRTIQFWIYWWPIMHWKWNLWDYCIPRYLQKLMGPMASLQECSKARLIAYS